MATPILTAASTVLCAHGGTASALLPSMRVRVAGSPAVVIASPHAVAGCPFPPPPVATGPCITAQWLLGSARVRLDSRPAAISSGVAICVPTGTALNPVAAQSKVLAT